MGQAILGFILGGGFLTFVQFLITRSDSKNDQFEAIVKAIAEIKTDIDSLRKEIAAQEEKNEERATIQARIRILDFCDELQSKKWRSKDSYDQCMHDIDVYEDYCDTHKDFKNNQTETTIAYIKNRYKYELEVGKFRKEEDK